MVMFRLVDSNGFERALTRLLLLSVSQSLPYVDGSLFELNYYINKIVRRKEILLSAVPLAM